MNYFDNCMTHEQLEQEHRRLVIKMHPDRNPDDPNATAAFQEMQQQYEERKAELNGDYRKARKGRERREREERERKEREAREQGRRRVEAAVNQARLNRQKSHRELKAGDFIYARQVKVGHARMEALLHDVVKEGVFDEAVVMIETVVEMTDENLMSRDLNNELPSGVWGGWETLQMADPTHGIPKAKRVSRVVMFRSPSYCVFGNPMGDRIISRFYMPHDFGVMYRTALDDALVCIERQRREAERIEAERKAKIEAEQRPMIEEWREKLISLSRGLTDAERQTVAVENMKRVLKSKFPGVTFRIKTNRYGETSVAWEDGPTEAEVVTATDLFNTWLKRDEHTPWMQLFGTVSVSMGDYNRKMSTLTKARILQQLGEVTDAFREGEIGDDVTVSEWDWTMLHVLCGVQVSDPDARLCLSTLHADGRRTVTIIAAVRYVFQHTSYNKATKRQKKAA